LLNLLATNSRELLSLHKEALEHLNALPEALASATNILHGAHAEFALTRDANKREMDELRRNNTEYQVQMAKARGAHGQVRVEKEVIAEKLSIVEADRDCLRLQLKELQASTSSKAIDLTAVEARNKELEDALAKALARLQASDVTHQTSQERILELERVNRELTSEKQTLKSKVRTLKISVGFADFV
jgi:chromosome segregation ATPase